MRYFMLLAFAAVTGLPGLRAQSITNFGSTATSSGGWTYTPGTSTLSGTEGLGDVLFGAPMTMNLGANRYLRLTGTALVAPSGSFTITLEDNAGKTAIARYTWGQFLGGATATIPIQYSTFNFANVTGWSIDSGGSLQSLNASFSSLLATSVPEPSAFAIYAAGFLFLWIARRELRKIRPARF